MTRKMHWDSKGKWLGVFAPDSFTRDWYGHLTNQGAHGGLVGVGLTLLTLPFLPPVAAWFAVVLAYFVIWEVVIGARIKEGDLAPSWDWRDSIDDTSNVGGGSAVICALAFWIDPVVFWWAWSSAALCFVIWSGALVFSTWRRK